VAYLLVTPSLPSQTLWPLAGWALLYTCFCCSQYTLAACHLSTLIFAGHLPQQSLITTDWWGTGLDSVKAFGHSL
jgi:hypothetical protein